MPWLLILIAGAAIAISSGKGTATSQPNKPVGGPSDIPPIPGGPPSGAPI
jgi:hypothetical protein